MNIFYEMQSTIMGLEEQVWDVIIKNHIEPLKRSLKANLKLFSFISEKEFCNIGNLNFNCETVAKRVETQRKKFAEIIDMFNKFEGMMLSEQMNWRLYTTSMDLCSYAIQFGYNKEACNLLKIVKNPKLTGDYSIVKVNDKLVQISKNYGKREILENDNSFKEDVDRMIVDLATGAYGDENTQENREEIEKAYYDVTVRVGDTFIKIDRTMAWAEENKEIVK